MNIIPLAPFQAVNERGKRIGSTDSQKRYARRVVFLDLASGISQAMAVTDGWRALRSPSNQGGLVA